MKGRYSPDFIDLQLNADINDYHSLVELTQALCSSRQYSWKVPDYGLPEPAFLFCETLLWFAQAMRSGVWTYFEATPARRQGIMLSALKSHGPRGYARAYSSGMADWEDETKTKVLDRWIQAHDDSTTRWLHRHALKHRTLIHEVAR